MRRVTKTLVLAPSLEGWFLSLNSDFLEPGPIMDSSRLCGLGKLQAISANAFDFEPRTRLHGLEITLSPYKREEQVRGMSTGPGTR